MAKKALLIGINRYRVPGADLRGCVNDVDNIQDILGRLYGFQPRDISILTDFNATKKAIQSGITKLIKSGKKGDVLLLHYSGHGSNVPDDNGDEADRRDEIVCPTDLDWNDTLRDDWLRKSFDKLRKGVNLTVIMDCCHSGTITRQIQPPDTPSIARFLPCPLDLIAVESGRELTGSRPKSLRSTTRAHRKKKSDVVDANIPELLITGCRDTQTSADASINGTFNGALTYSLAKVIRDAKGRLTYGDLHAASVRWLRANGYDQVPQLEGMKAKFTQQFLAPAA